MRGPAKIAGSKMGYKTCPTCKGTGKVPVNTKTPKTKPKPMSSGSKMSDRGGPGKGSAGPGGRGGK